MYQSAPSRQFESGPHSGAASMTTVSQPTQQRLPADRYAQQLASLAEISRIVASAHAARETLSEVLRELGMSSQMRRPTLLVLSPTGEELVVAVALEQPDANLDDLRYARGEGVTGRVLQTGRPAIVPRVSSDVHFRQRIYKRVDEAAAMSFICVPIFAGGQLIGALSVDLPPRTSEELREASRFLTIVGATIASEVAGLRTQHSPASTISASTQPTSASAAASFEMEDRSLPNQTATLERRMINAALNRSGGNVAAAARDLDITPRMIRYKMKKLDITNQRFTRRD
jgi:transcriptional regulator with GAF, ATPase, and Fis domain